MAYHPGDAPFNGLCLPLEDVLSARTELAGVKMARLAGLAAAGFAVPHGFVVTAEAMMRFFAETGLEPLLSELEEASDPARPMALASAGSRARREIMGTQVPPTIAGAIVEAYERLCLNQRFVALPVAVRASPVAEDAGNVHESFLGIQGADAVLNHVRRAWAGLFSDRALERRRRAGLSFAASPLAAGVLRLVHAAATGTAAPGPDARIVIEANWGFRRAVAEGLAAPDRATVAGRDLRLEDYRIGSKEMVSVFDHAIGGVRSIETPAGFRSARVLTEEEALAIARMAFLLAEHSGHAVAIAWAIERHRPPGESLALLTLQPGF